MKDKALSYTGFLWILMPDNQQLYSSSPAMLKDHLLREQPVPRGLRSLWRFMTQNADKEYKNLFKKDTEVFYSFSCYIKRFGLKLSLQLYSKMVSIVSIYIPPKEFYKKPLRQILNDTTKEPKVETLPWY